MAKLTFAKGIWSFVSKTNSALCGYSSHPGRSVLVPALLRLIKKDCEHPLAPRQKKYVRVRFYRSGWHIRQVPGRDACEIIVVHQEDAGLNVEMAKLTFAKGIWSFVSKTNSALCGYSSHPSRSVLVPALLRLIKKNHEVDRGGRNTAISDSRYGRWSSRIA
ncbi:uncharacterized protein LOC121969563 isoform X3 [Zingiber officinale]|uniref:uncharacterized protein LOC121969563 isoform X3 n=1 Tax=Zingiber officinale TaxID=94328 RepID=UPI001C4DA366|nr:uncharacterized protein LOC121969563 isoform X3 [Zingiber officinale]